VGVGMRNGPGGPKKLVGVIIKNKRTNIIHLTLGYRGAGAWEGLPPEHRWQDACHDPLL